MDATTAIDVSLAFREAARGRRLVLTEEAGRGHNFFLPFYYRQNYRQIGFFKEGY